jgi:hypothetical protein
MNQRGIALPAALLALIILTSLMIAFAIMAQSEPDLANNHMLTARARSFAEAGVERGIWALNNTAASGVSDPPATAPPYDASQYFWGEQVNGVTVGEFSVTIAPVAGDPNSANITAVGFTPDHNNPRAIKKIQVTVSRFRFGGPSGTPPCAMCIGGEVPPGDTATLQVGGNATINGDNTSGSPPATYCAGQVPTTAIMTTGSVFTNGSPNIVAPLGGQQTIQGVDPSTFSAFTLTNADMQVLKAYAKANGTYLQGSQNWTSPPPNGLVFVDTPSGNPLTNNSPSSDKFTVTIHGNWSQGWNGWLIIAGSADLSGQINMTGLVYAQNDVQIHGNGNQHIVGAVIAQDRVDSVSSTIDAQDIGNGNLAYSCPAVRDGGGTVSNSWFISSYKEVQGT